MDARHLTKIKELNVLLKLLPVLSFIIPVLVLYFLHPESFQGRWEGFWQGRFLYLFFLWLVSLEIILSWEKLRTKINKIRSIRAAASITALLLPSIYVVVVNYCGLNTIIKSLAAENKVPHANLMPLSTEYLIFAVLFGLIILLVYGINCLTEFSISVVFLGVIGLTYMTDNLYPTGSFTPFQLLVFPTATLAKSILELMGYQTTWRGVIDGMPTFSASDSQGRSSPNFSIAWPCAGVESLLIYTLTILLFLKKSVIPWKHRIIYFVIGAIVTYLVNILRIVSIYVISINGGDWILFHNFYGPLYSITWIISYLLIIIGSQALWEKIRKRKDREDGSE